MSRLIEPSPPPADLADVGGVLRRHADNASAVLALNRGTRHFCLPHVDGVVAYRAAGRSSLVQLGGVFAPPADRPELLEAFRAFAAAQRRRVVAVQLLPADAQQYAAAGFTVNQIGAEYSRALPGFSLAGKKHVQLRNKVSRSRRAGVRVVEVGRDVAATAEREHALAALDAQWLAAKGRHTKELTFLVGERGGPAAALRRLFVAEDASGAPLAYVSFSPTWGPQSGWLHDLSRRRPDAPPGALEHVVVTAVERFRAEGAGFLHFGFTPFTSLDPCHEQPGASALVRRVVGLLAAHGSRVYPAADQLAYKAKWGLDVVQPSYVAFDGRPRPRAVWDLLRLTGAA
jgi:lysylphosphatidylglycerol synthetase-like protein (DUF2156 family)